jgi:hypothetical protein
MPNCETNPVELPLEYRSRSAVAGVRTKAVWILRSVKVDLLGTAASFADHDGLV